MYEFGRRRQTDRQDTLVRFLSFGRPELMRATLADYDMTYSPIPVFPSPGPVRNRRVAFSGVRLDEERRFVHTVPNHRCVPASGPPSAPRATVAVGAPGDGCLPVENHHLLVDTAAWRGGVHLVAASTSRHRPAPSNSTVCAPGSGSSAPRCRPREKRRHHSATVGRETPSARSSTTLGRPAARIPPAKTRESG